MQVPSRTDYIDIHNHSHESSPDGVFTMENLMVHEGRYPLPVKGLAYSAGIHPWHVDINNHLPLLKRLGELVKDPLIIAVGEAGFDKLKGSSMDLQRIVFEEQVRISESNSKPLVIHCVKSWEELLSAHKQLKPVQPWLVHGFRSSIELAGSLLARGFYLSFWFDFVLRPESATLLRSLPADRIFLETDGSGAGISDIYNKVSSDLGLTLAELKDQIFNNFLSFFGSKVNTQNPH